jgi:hypothetical protein
MRRILVEVARRKRRRSRARGIARCADSAAAR